MIIAFVLVVITHVNSGSVVSFQEFNSQSQCQYVAGIVGKAFNVEQAFCVKK